MKENTTKDIDIYSKDTTVIERPESYNIGVKVGWTAPAKWWNWLFNACTLRLKELFNTTTSIHNEIKNAVGGTLDPESDTQLKDKLEKMKKDLEDMTAQVSANLAALEATKAKPNGIASLDPDGRIPYSQLPESAMEFKGDWDASTNTPALADGTGDLGDMYLVSVGGTVDLGSGSIIFLDGDRVIYNQAGKWEKISGGSVKSVNKTTPDATGNVDVVVNTSHIADGAITRVKIADGAITTAKIVDGAVTGAKIADGAITTGRIATSAVTAGRIATGAVTTFKIEDSAVIGVKIAAGAVTAGKIAAGAVTEAKIADGAVTSSKVSSSSNMFMHSMYIYCKGNTADAGIRLILVIFSNYSGKYASNVLKLIKDMVSIYGTGGRVSATGICFMTTSAKYTVVGASAAQYQNGNHRLNVYTSYTNNDLNVYSFDIKEGNTDKIEIITEVRIPIIGS